MPGIELITMNVRGRLLRDDLIPGHVKIYAISKFQPLDTLEPAAKRMKMSLKEDFPDEQ